MKLTGKHIGIILFTLATAVLHIILFPDIMFTLNGIGYLALLAAYFLPIPFLQEKHNLIWWLLVGYTALTIILWVIMGDKNFVPGTSSATTGARRSRPTSCARRCVRPGSCSRSCRILRWQSGAGCG